MQTRPRICHSPGLCLPSRALWFLWLICTAGTMGGSAVTTALTALLCLGMCSGRWEHVQAGTLPKPSLWADSGSMIPLGSPVTLWCQGTQQADSYHLRKEGVSKPWDTQTPLDSRDTVGFSIESMSAHTAGRFQCVYHSSGGWSEPSDPLHLVVTGAYSKPSLSAQPSPVVASGGSVTLSCGSQNLKGTFHLLKEGGASPARAVKSQFSAGAYQALFPMDPVTAPHGGTYRCYGSSSSYPDVWSLPSDPLAIEVTGLYRAPSLSGPPGTLVLSGDTLSLQCHSEAGFDTFALTKDEELTAPQGLVRQLSPQFPLGRVNSTHGGRYRCYGGHRLSPGWSDPSQPLDILVTGLDRKPSLSAQPGPSVSTGENVTLQCRSETPFDTFHLSKEGSVGPPQSLRASNMAGTFQADFTMSPVASSHRGTYRCYGSRSKAPHLLSEPSEPLELLVSGLKQYLNILIGASVAFVLLLLFLLFLLIRRQRQGKSRKPGSVEPKPKDRGLQKSSSGAADLQEETLYATMKDTLPKDRQLNSQSPEHVEPEEVTYSQVNHTRHRQGVTTSDGQREDRQMDSQTVPSEGLQEVTYAQLNHLTLGQETTAAPPSWAEPSIYASLTTR
ncbi:leukocyte immunoglobulin-like receptor subfamily B member 3 isoform X2 [Tamandua tetradactyla]|uniref:leukocyte immunoglobulin-like receptor subfamily B member 3 isoform X2 n=1 Tax=Tamandua tetradactyla TaxID=48850 RepID=UPI004053D0DB